MAKPNKKTRETKELIFEEPIFISSKKKTKIFDNNDFKKKILIVCEGATEYSYFEGLCNFYDVQNLNNFKIVVLPEKKEDNTSGYKGSSIKGLVYEAMKKNHIDSKYDETWIITDNDECNSYKLNNESLQRIKTNVPVIIHQRLTDFQLFEMNVRDSDIDKQNRIRYFLNQLEYVSFLKQNILFTDYDLSFLDIIIDNTTKKNDFELFFDSNSDNYFHDPIGNFIINENLNYEKKYFDKNWKNYKIAFTSIAFEFWLLLHFEKNNSSFYNSKEIIKYFDDKNYFNTIFKKGKSNGFQKGYHLYELLKENNEVVKSFFKLSNSAIFNNLISNNEIQSQINSNTRFFEVNPYSDVYKLTTFLLNKTYLTQAFLNIKTSFFDFKDILVSHNEETINFSFIFDGKISILKNQISEKLSIKDSNNSNVEIDLKFNIQNLAAKNDIVEIQINFINAVILPYFLEFKYNIKEIENQLIWVI